LAAAGTELFLLLIVIASIGEVVLDQPASGECAPRMASRGGNLHGVPRRLIPLYVGAAERYSLGPRGPGILAAINFVETDFGQNMGTSSAGANGWMAFLPSSWQAYGVDADGDGRKDPYDPADAIYAAARLLRAAGGPRDWYGAVFAYNHVDWYVRKVFRHARRFSGIAQTSGTAPMTGASAGSCPGSTSGSGAYVNPLGSNADWLPERTDMGVDYGPLRPSVPVLALGEARVLGSTTHSGWPGGGFIWYRLLGGDHRGDVVYVAETISDLAPTGTRVTAGQRIAVAHTGGTGIETGWATASGADVLLGRGFEAGAGLPYQPIGDACARAWQPSASRGRCSGTHGLPNWRACCLSSWSAVRACPARSRRPRRACACSRPWRG
jgi:hypothetical protein